MTTIPAFTIGGITRPELFLDPNGNIVLTPDAQAFAGQYGLKALYLGVPPGTPYPPVPGSPTRRRSMLGCKAARVLGLLAYRTGGQHA